MLRAALLIASKDLRLVAVRGAGLVQALLLGLLLIFLFSLAGGAGDRLPPHGAAVVFWLSTAFCLVLIFHALYSLEETDGARQGLLLSPIPIQAVWLGKALAGFLLLLAAQVLFLAATVAFLGHEPSGPWLWGLVTLLAVNWGLVVLGSLLGAVAQGQAARESLLSIILFPLLVPLLLAGVRVGAAVFGGKDAEGLGSSLGSWLGITLAFGAIYSAAGLVLFPHAYGGEE